MESRAAGAGYTAPGPSYLLSGICGLKPQLS